MEVIGLNLLLADWGDEDHHESILAERNSKWGREYLTNVKCVWKERQDHIVSSRKKEANVFLRRSSYRGREHLTSVKCAPRSLSQRLATLQATPASGQRSRLSVVPVGGSSLNAGCLHAWNTTVPASRPPAKCQASIRIYDRPERIYYRVWSSAWPVCLSLWWRSILPASQASMSPAHRQP